MKEKPRETGKEVAGILWDIFGRVLVVHLFYVAAGMAVFTPLLGLVGRIFLHFSGKSMLSDMDIAFFALTPVGMTAVVLFGAMLITIIVFEQASLMALAAGSMQGREVGIVPALMFTVHRTKGIFFFAFRLVVRVLVIVMPFAAAGAVVVWLLLSDFDINYYLSEKPPVFFAAASLITAFLLAMVVILIKKLVDWALALPLVLLAGVTPVESFIESKKHTAGHKKLLVSLFVFWLLAIILLEIILLGTVQFAGEKAILRVQGSISLLVLVLGGVAALISLGSFFITTLSSGSFACLLVVFARQCGLDVGTIRFSGFQEERTVRTKKIAVPRLTLLFAGGTVISLLTGVLLMDGVRTVDDVVIIAHRGAAGKAPENTIAAVSQAVADGADWVEIDVQETADGRIAVVHDSDLMKLAGNDMKIWDATLEELQQVDVGSWFSPEFSGERIPALEDVLERVRGKARLLIELKYYGHDLQLEQRVVDIVEQEGMVEDVAVMSLKQAGVDKAHDLRPDWSYGLLSSKTVGDISRLKMDFLAVNMATTSAGLIRRIHKAGKQVYVWTVNDAVSISRMISLGVDGIITDEPELAKQVLAERVDMNSSERLLLHAAVLFGRPLPAKTYRDDSP